MAEDRWAGIPPMMAQGQIINEMAQSMVSSITGDWDHAIYTIIRFGGQGAGRFDIVNDLGETRLGRDMGAFRLSVELKRVMCVPGRGSWFTMTLKRHGFCAARLWATSC